MTFINLRGTSGSGKTTLIREIMEHHQHVSDIFIEGRKRPIYSVYEKGNGEGCFAIMGHYETACGGCDTINKLDTVFEQARIALRNAHVSTVIAEGLLLGKDVSRIVTMENPHVVYVDTPIEECYEGVRNRRLNKYISEGKEPDMEKVNKQPKALANDHKSILSAVNRLRDKVTVHEVSRESGLRTILKLI